MFKNPLCHPVYDLSIESQSFRLSEPYLRYERKLKLQEWKQNRMLRFPDGTDVFTLREVMALSNRLLVLRHLQRNFCLVEETRVNRYLWIGITVEEDKDTMYDNLKEGVHTDNDIVVIIVKAFDRHRNIVGSDVLGGVELNENYKLHHAIYDNQMIENAIREGMRNVNIPKRIR